MADLLGARQKRLTAEETDVLVRAVKDGEVTYEDGRNPPKSASVKQTWEEKRCMFLRLHGHLPCSCCAPATLWPTMRA